MSFDRRLSLRPPRHFLAALARDKLKDPAWERKRLSPNADQFPPSEPIRQLNPAAGRFARAGAGRWKRPVALAAFSLIALLVSVAALAPWLFSPAALLKAIADQLQSSSGLFVATRGRTTFALTPQPHISIDGVAFADRNGSLVIEADQLHGVLNLLPLVTGRLEVGALALVKPRATVELDQKPIDAPGVAARAAAAMPATPEAHIADKARLGVIAIVDGTLRLKRGGRDFIFENINITLDWRRIGQAATLTGGFNWRGERLETMLWIAQPAALMRGEQSVATATLNAPSIRIEAKGLAQGGGNMRFLGRLAGSAPSARDALRLLDLRVPLPGPFSDAQFSAQASIGARESHLQDLHFLVDGNEFDGAATLRFEEGRPSLTAKLKSNYVSMKPMLMDAPALTASDGQWSHEDFEPPDVSGADVDLRLDAAHARLGRLAVDDATIALTLRGGALDLALTQAQAYRGVIKARAEIRPSDRGLSTRLTAQTARVDAGALLWDAFGKQAIAGALDANVSLDAVGANTASLIRSLSGRVTLKVTDGQIAGVDLDRALRRLEKRPLASAQDIRSGRSTLEAAEATIAIEGGVGAIENGAAHGPGFALSYSGATNFVERSLALKAVAQEADNAGIPRDKGLSIAFDLSGGWDDLALTPDAQAFIRRSGAAAPLLPRAETPAAQTPTAP